MVKDKEASTTHHEQDCSDFVCKYAKIRYCICSGPQASVIPYSEVSLIYITLCITRKITESILRVRTSFNSHEICTFSILYMNSCNIEFHGAYGAHVSYSVRLLSCLFVMVSMC